MSVSLCITTVRESLNKNRDKNKDAENCVLVCVECDAHATLAKSTNAEQSEHSFPKRIERKSEDKQKLNSSDSMWPAAAATAAAAPYYGLSMRNLFPFCCSFQYIPYVCVSMWLEFAHGYLLFGNASLHRVRFTRIQYRRHWRFGPMCVCVCVVQCVPRIFCFVLSYSYLIVVVVVAAACSAIVFLHLVKIKIERKKERINAANM